MAMKSMKDLREIAEAALATGVANKEQLQSAVPALVALQNAKRSMELRIKETKEVIEALSAACSAYAHRHPEYVFNQSFSVSPIGVESVESGDLEIDGKTYHFAHGFDGYDRAEQGQKMTQAFLATLPKGWTKSKLELDKSAVNKAKPTEDDLAEVGLVRKVKQTWTELP